MGQDQDQEQRGQHNAYGPRPALPATPAMTKQGNIGCSIDRQGAGCDLGNGQDVAKLLDGNPLMTVISRWISVTIAYPPPNVKRPMRKKVKNSCQRIMTLHRPFVSA
jgi:hypothetical protein